MFKQLLKRLGSKLATSLGRRIWANQNRRLAAATDKARQQSAGAQTQG